MSSTDARQQAKDRLQHHLSEMWPVRNPVRYESEEELYAHVRATFETFWDPLDERYFDVAACTVLLSFRMKQFTTTPYPFLFGPPGSGKTRCLDVFSLLCYNPILSPSVSPAAMYQVIDRLHPTLLVDETDNFGSKNPDERSVVLCQILNAGYRRGQKVVRASREGSDPVLYDVFGLKVLAGTEPQPDTLAARTIRLDCVTNIKDIPVNIDPAHLEKLRGQLEAYYCYYDIGKAPEGYPQPRPIDVEPEELKLQIGDNRTAELFLPLYAVCPSPQGRQNLLSLAKEAAAEKQTQESTGDLAEVLEAVWRQRVKVNPKPILESERPTLVPLQWVIDDCPFETKSKDQDATRWAGWRLRKLQFRRERKDGTRYVVVEDRKLYRLARRYLPLLARGLSLTTATTATTPAG